MVALARSRRPLPQREDLSPFAADVLAGLERDAEAHPGKILLRRARARRCSRRITEQPEYYPTRCEMEILRDQAASIAALIPDGAAVVEFGSGSNKKARLLLAAAPQSRRLCAGRHLRRDARGRSRRVARRFPRPRRAAGRGRLLLPVRSAGSSAKAAPLRVGFFPGSTIGNFEPHEAAAFLRNAAKMLGPKAEIIIGVDLIKPAEILNAAYNDAAGVTAAFNLNLLVRMNRELGANFRLECFEHHAFYQSRAQPHRDAPRQPEAAEGEGCRRDRRFPRRRDHPHREQLQILASTRCGRWPAASAGCPTACGPTAQGYFSVQAFTFADEPSGPRRAG